MYHVFYDFVEIILRYHVYHADIIRDTALMISA